MKKKRRILTYIPMLIAAVLCISSPLTGGVFYVNAENKYVHSNILLYRFYIKSKGYDL